MTSSALSNSNLYCTTDFLDRLKNRESDLLAKVFQETNPVLLKLAAANGIFAENAEDLVHQTWERFFTNLEKFEGRSELRTFICGILINKIREFRRASGRIIFDEDSEAVMDRSFTSDGWWNTEYPDPLATLHSSQVRGFIEECLDGLTENQKAAFILKEVEQEKTDEICNVLGVSVSNLRVLIFRAKDKLRQCLEGKIGISEQA